MNITTKTMPSAKTDYWRDEKRVKMKKESKTQQRRDREKPPPGQFVSLKKKQYGSRGNNRWAFIVKQMGESREQKTVGTKRDRTRVLQRTCAYPEKTKGSAVERSEVVPERGDQSRLGEPVCAELTIKRGRRDGEGGNEPQTARRRERYRAEGRK